jgi:hypothetical protein
VHLPNRGGKAPEVLRGTAGFVVPSLEEAKKRLEHAGNEMKRIAPDVKTRFSWREKEGTIEATCPWGNRVRLHAPSPEFGRTELALAYVDFDVPQGTAEGIARFYNEIMRAPARFDKNRTSVSIGRDQRLFFTETAAPQPEYDNHHIQIYIADFASPYHWLKERGLINMETDAEEWRFQWITDPRDGRKLFQIEHEVRSMKHRLFARPLVNRNHGVTNLNFVPGADAFRGTY